MPTDQPLKTLALMLDVLPSDESARDGMRAFFEKHSHEGFPPMPGDPVSMVAGLVENKTGKLSAFSNWVAGCLDEVPNSPEYHPMDIPQENLLEGLFRWCCYRPDPKRYAENLLKIKDATERSIANGWTAPLRRAFKHALIANQQNDTLQEFWLDLLDGTKPDHDFQRYWPDDFEGLLHMPAADGGGFAWSAIGTALKSIYETLLPGNNTKSLSPSGPMRGLYLRLGSIADLDEPDLSSKLWELAAQGKWNKPHKQTIPKQFLRKQNGDIVIPKVAFLSLLQDCKVEAIEMGVETVVAIPASAQYKIPAKAVEAVEIYESGRQNSPRAFREEMFYEGLGRLISVSTRNEFTAKNTSGKRLMPSESIRKNGLLISK